MDRTITEQGSISIEDIIEELENAGIIEPGEANPDNGQVKTEPDGYVYEITEDGNGNWKVEYVGKGEIERPEITISIFANPTGITNKVTLTVISKSEAGIKSLVSSIGETKTYGDGTNEINESFEITANGTYTFTVENNNGTQISKEITINNILEGIIQIRSNTTMPTKDNVQVTITWPEGSERGIKEIKVGNNSWQSASGDTSVVEVMENCTVVARVSNNEGEITQASITISNIDKTYPSIVANETEEILYGEKVNVSNYFEITSNGKAEIINIEYRDENNNQIENTSGLQEGEHKIKCTVTKETGLSAEKTITIAVKQIVNEPQLTEGMIPVKYNKESKKWVICEKTDKDWYSYTETDKKWANVMLCDGKYNESTPVGTEVEEKDLGSMFVWVPRYAYKITSGYHSTSGSIDVKFVNGTEYDYIDEEGIRQTAKRGTDSGVITTSGYTDYIVHPSFTNGNGTYDYGEWDKEIKGIWVAKFQAGIYTTTEDTNQKVTIGSTSIYYPVFKGRKFAYNYLDVSQCYNLSLALDDSNNPYGLSTKANSHLMKSSEWGAVAYLSISKYGYSGGTANASTEKYKNNVSLVSSADITKSPVTHPNNSSRKITAITGYSANGGKTAQNIIKSYTNPNSSFTDVITNTSTSYAWNYTDTNSDVGAGTKSSTTGNIYGIYDMGGCLADYVSAYIKNGNTQTYGSAFATNVSTRLATAYPSTACTSSGVYDFNTAYPGFNRMFGDATYETSAKCGDNSGWFGQNLEADVNNSSGDESFFPRGGDWRNTVHVGLCGLYDHSGNAHWRYGFLPVLVVE